MNGMNAVVIVECLVVVIMVVFLAVRLTVARNTPHRMPVAAVVLGLVLSILMVTPDFTMEPGELHSWFTLGTGAMMGVYVGIVYRHQAKRAQLARQAT